MADKVKPLGFENSALGGTESLPTPTEIDPSEDFLAAKGMAFENSDSFLVQKLGRIITGSFPHVTTKIGYLGNGDVDYVEFFNSASQVTANRIARVDLTYSSGDPATEAWKVYDTNGTTILETTTLTYSYSSGDIDNVTVSVT